MYAEYVDKDINVVRSEAQKKINALENYKK